MSVDYEYDFEKGLYRATIKTTYRRSDMSMNDYIYSNEYRFNPNPPDHIIFKNGALNPNVVIGLDMTHYVEDARKDNNFNHLSAYFLTDYNLIAMQTNATRFYVGDNGFITKNDVVGTSGINHAVPIKRISRPKKLEFDGRMYSCRYVGYDLFHVLVGWIDSNDTFQLGWKDPIRDVTQWTHYSYDISNVPYIDYIVFNGCDGIPQLNNVVVKGGTIDD